MNQGGETVAEEASMPEESEDLLQPVGFFEAAVKEQFSDVVF